MTVELEDHVTGGSFCLDKGKIKSVGVEQFEGLTALVDHLRSEGSRPSSEFGMWAGNPPPPPRIAGAQLWLQRRIAPLHNQSTTVVCGLIFAIVLASASAMSWRKWRRSQQSPSVMRG